jgi:hypothetical protein
MHKRPHSFHAEANGDDPRSASSAAMDRARTQASRGFLSSVVGKALLQDAARVLNAASVPVMPLKGILLQHTVYDDPAERTITDVDLLVPAEHAARAHAALVEASFVSRAVPTHPFERVYQRPDDALAVDLHTQIFPPHRFRPDDRQLFARSARNTQVFGVPVMLPDPCDLYAHLVGNFTKDHANQENRMHLRDFGAVARRFALEPGQVAEHLARTGLARAARYTLGYAVAVERDAFAARVIACLPRDALGRALAGGAIGVTMRLPRSAPAAKLAAHLLKYTLLHAARSILWASAQRLRNRIGR